MRRSTSGQRRKVEEAKRVVQLALGDAVCGESPKAAAIYLPLTKPTEPVPVHDESVIVLTLREAAMRLGITTGEMESMVKRRTVKSLTAGWTTMIPVSEVARLSSGP